MIIYLIVLCILIILIVKVSRIEKFGSGSGSGSGSGNGSGLETIFVSVASYRDHECSDTIESMFLNAKEPSRIFVGICEQNSEDPLENCNSNKDLNDYRSNIRIHKMNFKEAKGPTYARYHCSKLYKGEDYYFQIDSHTSFEKDWDQKLIDMFKQCLELSEKPVLSAYPPTKKQIDMNGFPVMDGYTMGQNGIPVFSASFMNIDTDRPIKSPKPFCAAGFMFLKGSFLKEIPYDPNLKHLFQGEEYLFSARLFTHGYDIYNPHIKVCSHHYNRKGSLYWNDITDHDVHRRESEKKVIEIINARNGNDYPYGLGSERSMSLFF